MRFTPKCQPKPPKNTFSSAFLFAAPREALERVARDRETAQLEYETLAVLQTSLNPCRCRL